MDYMSNDTVTARNTDTRKVGEYKRRIVEHPVLGKFLEEVPSGSKDFVPYRELVPLQDEVIEYEDAPEEEED